MSAGPSTYGEDAEVEPARLRAAARRASGNECGAVGTRAERSSADDPGKVSAVGAGRPLMENPRSAAEPRGVRPCRSCGMYRARRSPRVLELAQAASARASPRPTHVQLPTSALSSRRTSR